MRRRVLLLSAPAVAAMLLLGGCSLYRRGLGSIKAETGGALVPVCKADFPTGDPGEGAAGTAQGSRILAYAAQGHGAVAAAVRAHGIPDAVAITGSGSMTARAHRRGRPPSATSADFSSSRRRWSTLHSTPR